MFELYIEGEGEGERGRGRERERERERYEVVYKTLLHLILSRSLVSSKVHPSRGLTTIIMTSAPIATASDDVFKMNFQDDVHRPFLKSNQPKEKQCKFNNHID